jgi:putative membrane protein
METPPARPHDVGTRLAMERTLIAYERTLMAWVRTATSLISFGFTIYKFFQFEAGRSDSLNGRLLTPRQFGMIMIATGLVALALSTIEHRQNIRRLQADLGTTQRSVAVVVAAIVSGMGLLAFVAALFRA